MIYATLQTLMLATWIVWSIFHGATTRVPEQSIKIQEGEQARLFVTGEFQTNNVFLLMDIILLNHWFLSIL